MSLEDFEKWWNDEGSGLRPGYSEDHEEHVLHLCKIAWANGEYKAGGSSIADLVEHWERRCVALDRLLEDAAEAIEPIRARLAGKAAMARSMTVELKRELRKTEGDNDAD